MSPHEEIDPCEVCADQRATTLPSGGFDGIHQDCPRCGKFKLSGTASSTMRQGLGRDRRARLSGWIRNQNRLGSVPMITSENLGKILAIPLPSVLERANALLDEAAVGLEGLGLGAMFNIGEPRFLAATYSSTWEDVGYLLAMLRDQGLAKEESNVGDCRILPGGYVRLDELKGRRTMSANGFVAMSFDQALNKTYSDGFQVGILGAGYDPIRMDRVEHVNRIDDEIIKQINSSRFVVADFTGHRSGVYFEAGYALGIGIPVFWTCYKTDMSDLHFDIRQFNCIDWQTPEELAKRLRNRLEAVLGPGPKSDNA